VKNSWGVEKTVGFADAIVLCCHGFGCPGYRRHRDQMLARWVGEDMIEKALVDPGSGFDAVAIHPKMVFWC
jgi:hypothetical protein